LKSILGSLTLGLFLTLAYGALGLYEVSRDKAIAPNEGIAPNVGMQHSFSNTTGALRCTYGFRVGDNIYGGHGLCPTDGTANSIKGSLGSLLVPPNSTATVYYDPNDPSYNSLVDFSVKADNDSMKARLGFGLAAGCVLLLVIGVVIAGKASQPGGGIVVDSQGTMIYPDQINSDDERFSAHPKHISSEEQ
jgi:hypothetical protein